MNKAVKAGIGYTLGNILVRGINFLALPIFSRIMTKSEFGIYNLFLSYDVLLSVMLGLALHTCVRSANYEFKKKIDSFVSSILLLYLLNLLICFSIAICGHSYLTKLIGLDRTYLIMLVIHGFGGALISLYNARLSLDYSYNKYMKVAFGNSVGNVIFSLLLILTVFNSDKAFGRVLGITLISICISIYIISSFWRNDKPIVNYQYWKFAIIYSLPIVPHGLSQVVLGQFDRIMIGSMVGVAAVGVYSLAGTIKFVMLVVTDSVANAWTTWLYEKIELKEYGIAQEKAKDLCNIFCLLAAICILIVPEIVSFLGGAGYEEGMYVAVPIAIEGFLLFIYAVVVGCEYYSKRTIYIMIGTTAAGILNIVTNYIFIPIYGFYAAAYTTLFSYLCYLIYHVIVSRKLVGFFLISWKTLFFQIFGLSCIGAFTLNFIDNLVIRGFVCTVFIGVLIKFIQGQYAGLLNKLFNKIKRN